MESTNHQRVDITSAEASYLTLGSWNGIAKGYELVGYCHECDDVAAVLTVTDYFLDLNARCVAAEGTYTCCGNVSAISFGILDDKLLTQVLTGSRKK